MLYKGTQSSRLLATCHGGSSSTSGSTSSSIYEDVLKYLKTVKSGNSRNSDRSRQELQSTTRDTASNIAKPKTETAKGLIQCYNYCDTEGHKSFDCSKSANKYSMCNRFGHLDIFCRTKPSPEIRNQSKKNLDSKDKEQVVDIRRGEQKVF